MVSVAQQLLSQINPRATRQRKIVEAFRSDGEELTPGEIARRSGLNDGSVRTAVSQMEEAGLLAKTSYGNYRLRLPSEQNDRSGVGSSAPADDHYPIPLIEVSAGAGAAGVEIHEVTHTERLPGLYIRQEYGIAPGRLVSLKVRGESMNAAPAHLAPGAVIKAALLDPGAAITHGAVYVVFGPTGLQIKRLLFGEESSGDGEPVRRVCLWSDNAEHGRDWIPMEIFYRDYRVVAAALKVERDL